MPGSRHPRRPRAYEEVAAMLTGQIVAGRRPHGERLPSETLLADEFRVSRATVREALRTLAARDLIRTAKGTGGGSYVQLPRVQHITTSLHTSLNILSAAEHITVEELLEARELLEVPAARLAAARRAETDVERLREAIRSGGAKGDAELELADSADFHGIVLETCRNTLLTIAARPVLMVLLTGLAPSSLRAEFHHEVRRQHHEIAESIDRGEVDDAGRLMHEHLAYLRPTFEDLWQQREDAKRR